MAFDVALQGPMMPWWKTRRNEEEERLLPKSISPTRSWTMIQWTLQRPDITESRLFPPTSGRLEKTLPTGSQLQSARRTKRVHQQMWLGREDTTSKRRSFLHKYRVSGRAESTSPHIAREFRSAQRTRANE
mmetsp:Transcript_37970/g.56461  ORF Transcript_37970/g.56461 Transcript_37970/m.56461 type:complete len:131 (+) Transcript_37970:1591-1983(+)